MRRTTTTIATTAPVLYVAVDPAGGTSPGLEVVDGAAAAGVVGEGVSAMTVGSVAVAVVVVVVGVVDVVVVSAVVVVVVEVAVTGGVVVTVVVVAVVVVFVTVVVVVVDVVVGHCLCSVHMPLRLPLNPVNAVLPTAMSGPELQLISTSESTVPAS